MKIREKLYRVVEKDTEYFEWYDIMMLICIWVSIVPLIFKEQNKFTYVITIITTLIFVIDYILRWITSDYRLKKGVTSFIKYPITFSAIFDLTIIIEVPLSAIFFTYDKITETPYASQLVNGSYRIITSGLKIYHLSIATLI